MIQLFPKANCNALATSLKLASNKLLLHGALGQERRLEYRYSQPNLRELGKAAVFVAVHTLETETIPSVLRAYGVNYKTNPMEDVEPGGAYLLDIFACGTLLNCIRNSIPIFFLGFRG